MEDKVGPDSKSVVLRVAYSVPTKNMRKSKKHKTYVNLMEIHFFPPKPSILEGGGGVGYFSKLFMVEKGHWVWKTQDISGKPSKIIRKSQENHKKIINNMEILWKSIFSTKTFNSGGRGRCGLLFKAIYGRKRTLGAENLGHFRKTIKNHKKIINNMEILWKSIFSTKTLNSGGWGRCGQLFKTIYGRERALGAEH